MIAPAPPSPAPQSTCQKNWAAPSPPIYTPIPLPLSRMDSAPITEGMDPVDIKGGLEWRRVGVGRMRVAAVAATAAVVKPLCGEPQHALQSGERVVMRSRAWCVRGRAWVGGGSSSGDRSTPPPNLCNVRSQ